jgi:primosomal protein N' (replication factor Y)
MMLAEFYQAKLILGSATPSLESYDLAMKDKLRYVVLMKDLGKWICRNLKSLILKKRKIKRKLLEFQSEND